VVWCGQLRQARLATFPEWSACRSEFPINIAVYGDQSLYNSNATFSDLNR